MTAKPSLAERLMLTARTGGSAEMEALCAEIEACWSELRALEVQLGALQSKLADREQALMKASQQAAHVPALLAACEDLLPFAIAHAVAGNLYTGPCEIRPAHSELINQARAVIAQVKGEAPPKKVL